MRRIMWLVMFHSVPRGGRRKAYHTLLFANGLGALCGFGGDGFRDGGKRGIAVVFFERPQLFLGFFLHASVTRPVENLLEELAGMRRLDLGEVFGQSCSQDHAAASATFRPKVDQPVRRFDHVKVMLDHQHGISSVDQTMQHMQQVLNIGEM